MKVFESVEFSFLLLEVQALHDEFLEAKKSAGSGFHAPNPRPERVKATLDWFTRAHALCKDVQLENAKQSVGIMQVHLKQDEASVDCSTLCANLCNARDAILADIYKRKFIQIGSDFSDYVNNEVLFGESVNKAFPDAVADIKEAGNSIAMDSGTAAVFHLMRAVEWGLRALCIHLGIIRVRRSKKPGNKKYTPIEYAQWERMLDEVQDKVDARITKLGPGRHKQNLQEFYYPLLRDLRGFKDAWRNHVMHSRATYTVKAAQDVCDHVKRFMSLLATKVSV